MQRVISVILTGNAAPLQSSLLTAGTAVKAFGVATVASGIAIAVALNKSVDAAKDFDREMRNVSTISKFTKENFDGMSSSVLDLARVLPQSAVTLAKGLYQITSSGFDGAEAMSVLNASARAASAGLTTADVAAKGVSAVLNAYGLSGFEAAKVSDILFQTVNKGVLSFEELSNQLGDFVAMAAAFGKNARGDFIVPFEDAAAALATMTLSGLNAAEASTSLNRVLQSLIKPSEAMAAVLKQQGYESGIAATEALGLKGVMDLLRDATGGNVEVLVRLFPEIRSARGALALMANEGKNYTEVARSISDVTERLNATQKAYNEQAKGAAFQSDLAKNSLNAFAIEMGQTFLPVLVEVSKFLGSVLGGLGALPPVAKDVLAVVAALAAGLLILKGVALLLGPGLATLAVRFPGLAAGISSALPVMGALGLALAAGAILLAGYGKKQAEAKAASDAFKQAVLAEADGVKGSIDASVAAALAKDRLVTAAKNAHLSLSDLNAAVIGDQQALVRALEALKNAPGGPDIKAIQNLLLVAQGFKSGSAEAKEFQKAQDELNPGAAQLRQQLSSSGAEVVSNAQKWDELAASVNINTFALARMADGSIEAAQAIVKSINATNQAFSSQTDIISGFSSVAQQRESALGRVATAEEAVAEASERSSERQVAGAERVAEAQQNYADTAERIAEQVAEAQERSAERQISAAEAVQAAEERANDSRKNAADRLKDAEQRLRDLQQRQAVSGDPKRAAEVAKQQELRKAQEDVTEARQEQAKVEKEAAQSIAKAKADQKKADEDALKAAEMTSAQRRQLADAEAGIAKAQQQAAKDAADSFKDLAAANRELAAAQSEVASLSLAGFFADQTGMAKKFVEDVQEAMRLGLDPALAERLLTAGPKQAAPILNEILSGNVRANVDMANEAQRTLSRISESTIETQRVVQRALNTSNKEIAAEYGTAMKILEAKAKLGGAATGQAIADALGLKVADVRKVASDYTIVLADELNMVLRGVGAQPIVLTTSYGKSGQGLPGGLTPDFAQGGRLPDEAKYQPAGTMVQWAEPETGGEWFLPNSQAKRGRSLGIASEMLDSWGYEIKRKEFAGGGFLSADDIPKPPNFDRFGDMLGRTGSETSRFKYEKVLEWIKSQVGDGYGYQALIDYLQLQGVPFTVTSALRPGSITSSGNLSLHSSGQAADFWASDMDKIFDAFLRVAPSMQELFFDPRGFSIKNGQRAGWTVGGHEDHVHAATWAGPGQGPGLPTGRVGGYNLGASDRRGAVATGQEMAAERGWSGRQWDDLYALWQQESNWDANAVNPSSGAYGIPQALPDAHGHPYALGDAPGQIRWGLDYISGRYGDPSAAQSHEVAYGWYGKGGFHGAKSYDKGGYLQPGVTVAYNGTGKPERVGEAIDYDRLAGALVKAMDGTEVRLDDRLVGAVSSGLRRRGIARGGMR